MKAKIDKAFADVLKYSRLVLSVVLMVIVAVALLRLLGFQFPALRLTEGNLQNLGIIVAACAWWLK